LSGMNETALSNPECQRKIDNVELQN